MASRTETHRNVPQTHQTGQKRTEMHQNRLKRPKTHGSVLKPPELHRFQAGKMCEVGQLHAGPYSPCGSTEQAAPVEKRPLWR